ncbi:MAG: hypothetical protein ACI9VS_003212 [Candidatus Binatia bacterium]|jgi:hypothetical protein
MNAIYEERSRNTSPTITSIAHISPWRTILPTDVMSNRPKKVRSSLCRFLAACITATRGKSLEIHISRNALCLSQDGARVCVYIPARVC